MGAFTEAELNYLLPGIRDRGRLTCQSLYFCPGFYASFFEGTVCLDVRTDHADQG